MKFVSEHSNSLENERRFYNDRWKNATSRHLTAERDPRERIQAIVNGILPQFCEIGRLEILDYGCGNGWLTKYLAPFGRITGIDLSDEGIRQASEMYPGHRFIRAAYFDHFAESESFDAVVSQEVIEHISYEEQADYLSECHRLLRPGGQLVITTPNKPAVKAKFRAAKKDISKLGDQPKENLLTVSELRSLVAQQFHSISFTTIIRTPGRSGRYKLLNSGRLANVIPRWNKAATLMNANFRIALTALRK